MEAAILELHHGTISFWGNLFLGNVFVIFLLLQKHLNILIDRKIFVKILNNFAVKVINDISWPRN